MKRLTIDQLNNEVLGWLTPAQQATPARERVMGIIRARRSGGQLPQPSPVSSRPTAALPSLPTELPKVDEGRVKGTTKPYQANYPFLKR